MKNQKYKIEYDLSTNFDKNLISGIREIDKDHTIKTVFGKLRKDVVGGGRSSMTLPQLSFKELRAYIDLCHQNKLQFNYLINPACLGNKEMNPRTHKKIVKYIGNLAEAQIDAITVNSPFLCELIKKQFPDLDVTIGVAASVFTNIHIKNWEELGANEITLPHGLNRNFSELENILNFTKDRQIRVRVIANNVCLHECPYKISHSTSQSHASQKGNSSSNLNIDYNLLSCNNKKIKKPEHIIASEWIRPEDVHLYEELCNKTGNHNFSIKLLDRTKTTDFLLRVVKAYTEFSFDGNLIDILNWPSKKQTKVVHKAPMYWSAFKERYKLKELYNYEDTYNLPEIHVDNKKLDGFIDKFMNNSECFEKVCGLDMQTQSSETCTYCKGWVKKAISYNQEEINQWIEKSDHTMEALKTSSFFGV